MAVLPSKFQELGRLRIGDQVALKGKNGTRPRRLDAFRLTSANKPRLEFAARLWGGEVTPWPDAPQEKQWQLYTEAHALPVVVPPQAAFSQWNEIWAGAECRLRCDGETIIACHDETRIGAECACAKVAIQERLERAKEGKACQTVSRISLLLPDLPGVGVWRFDTNSYYAGMELQGCVQMLEEASAGGTYIECTFQIEQRKVVRRVNGKPQTQVFPIVTLQPNVSMRQLLTRQIPEHALVAQLGPTPVRLIGEGPPAFVTDIFPDKPSTITNDPPPEDRAVPLPETGMPYEGLRFRLHALLLESSLTDDWRQQTRKALDDLTTAPGYLNHLWEQAQAHLQPEATATREEDPLHA